MLVIILFVVFAFLMQGRAHGEGGLGNGIVPDEYAVYGSEAGKGNYVVALRSAKRGIWVADQKLAEDLAFALNRAHEERTKTPSCEETKREYGPCLEMK